MSIKELLIGCGNSREKKLFLPADNTEWHDLVTLDFDPTCGADVIHDLNQLPYPFAENEFDELYAFEILEHLGKQGDWKFFLDQFTELWRITKPGGYLFATCPMPDSPWAWGDPSHTRIVSLESISFLSQRWYEKHVGNSPMSDFRWYYKADWELAWENHTQGGSQMLVLKAIKP